MKIWLAILICFVTYQALAQESVARSFAQTARQKTQISSTDETSASSSTDSSDSGSLANLDNSQIPSFLKNTHTSIKDPLSLRDPFKRQNSIIFKDERQRTLTKDKDSYSNYVTDLPTDVGLNTLKLVGILLGPQRRAIVRVGNNAQSFIVREGMTLGQEKAEVKAILPGGMVLVEKIKNVYNQDEYVETIIPLSRDEELEKKN